VLQRPTEVATKSGATKRAWSIPIYLVALALASTIPVVIVASYLTYHFVSESSQRTRADFEERLRLLRNAVEWRIGNVTEDLQILARSPALLDGDLVRFRRYALAAVDLIGGVGLALSERDGQQLVNTRLPADAPLPKRREMAAQNRVLQTGLPQVSDLVGASTDQQPIITIEVPVMVGSEVRYVLALGLAPTYLSSLMKEAVPHGMVGSIIDRKGLIIGRRAEFDDFNLLGKPSIPDVLAHLGESSAFWIEATSRSGIPTYTSLLRSEQTGWTINLAITRDAVDGPARRTVGLVVALALVSLGLSLLFARLISGRFLRALNGLQQHVMQIGQARMIHPFPGPVAEVNHMEEVLHRVGLDIRNAIKRQEILLDEINHRVKNTLATVQSIARLSLVSSDTVREYAKAFEQRLIALSDAYNLLTENNWEGADLRAIVERTLAPYARAGQTSIEGPLLQLTPRITLAFSAAIQELSTNAAKYGALSVKSGCVDVSWSPQQDGDILFCWVERKGPPVEKPTRRGFGTKLIQDILAGDSQWKVTLDYHPEGLRCTILFPVLASA
jgi:two-component sensor histidine kinase